jgi:hypothetical protein
MNAMTQAQPQTNGNGAAPFGAGHPLGAGAPMNHLDAVLTETARRRLAMLPQNMEELWDLAQRIADARWAPLSYLADDRNRSGPYDANKIFLGMMHGSEVGLTPMASLQSIAVINGTPAIWGDGALGIIRASGILEDFEETVDMDGADPVLATCRMKRRGERTEIVRTFSRAEAQKAGLWTKAGPWTNYPRRMLGMRARAWAMRDGFADVLRGLYIREEAEDIPAEPIDHGVRTAVRGTATPPPPPAGVTTMTSQAPATITNTAPVSASDQPTVATPPATPPATIPTPTRPVTDVQEVRDAVTDGFPLYDVHGQVTRTIDDPREWVTALEAAFNDCDPADLDTLRGHHMEVATAVAVSAGNGTAKHIEALYSEGWQPQKPEQKAPPVAETSVNPDAAAAQAASASAQQTATTAPAQPAKSAKRDASWCTLSDADRKTQLAANTKLREFINGAQNEDEAKVIFTVNKTAFSNLPRNTQAALITLVESRFPGLKRLREDRERQKAQAAAAGAK